LRAKSARLLGDVVALLTVSRAALAYNKDLQESQEPFYDAIETTRMSLAVLPVCSPDWSSTRAHEGDGARRCPGATDLAEHLVREGVPFRRAHEIVAIWSATPKRLGVSLTDVPEAELAGIAPELHPTACSP